MIFKFDVQVSVHREYIFKYNQKAATLHNSFNSARSSTCFRLFLRPSSGAQKLYIKNLVFVKPLLLPFAVVEELEFQHHDSEN
jgi:predicted membrane chloride channel (bestrophin family)